MTLKIFTNLLIIIFFVSSLKNIQSTSSCGDIDFDSILKDYLKNATEIDIFLDFDGTLAEITPHPNNTVTTTSMKNTLLELSKHPEISTTIISGRALSDVEQKIQIDNFTYSGNHGFEILFTNGSKYIHQIPESLSANFSKLLQELEQKVEKHNAWIENKIYSLTFHYHETPEHLKRMLMEQAILIVTKYGYRANQAHDAIEIKPPIQWNKGLAAEYILSHKYDDLWRNRKILSVGDDRTDEDIMKVIKGFGLSFRVTNHNDLVTNADYKIPTVECVQELLDAINRHYLKKQSKCSCKN
uniref:Trehalose 6-phosphate phosphatase n=1 Tax=Corethrella appendiculata TaxID=1370023 RepID=U5EQA7_9DIPT